MSAPPCNSVILSSFHLISVSAFQLAHLGACELVSNNVTVKNTLYFIFWFFPQFSLPNYLGLGAIVKLNVTAPEPWKILAISNYHQIKSTHPNQTNHLNCTLLLYRFSFVGLLPSSGALYIKMCHYWSAGKATFPLSWGGLWTQFLNVAQLWYTEWSPKVGNMFRRRIFC